MNDVLVSSLVNAGLLLLLGAALYAAPSPLLNPRTVPFGVRVPPERAEDPRVDAERRRYRAPVLWATVVGTVAATGLGALLDSVAAGVVTGLVLCAVAAVLWLRAHRALSEAKERGDWYAGLRQGAVADTSLRTDPVRLPWAWSVPSFVVIAVTAVIGAFAYPGLPDTLAMPERSGDGTRYHEVATTFWTAFSMVFGQILGTAALLALVAAMLRSRADLDASRPAASSARHRRFLALTSRALLAISAVVDLMLLGLSGMLWTDNRSTPVLFTVVGVPALVTLGIVVLLAVRVGPGGERLPEGADSENTGMVQRDDDRHWRAGGTVYTNGDDPAVLVPRRVGMGWTLNLGNPRALIGSVAVLVLVLGAAALATLGLLG
ncbi:DUF1648 domain-containing protein [Streptomyces cacaoi]|uniref:DUF1648 domain-containing protein n=1 Tax=Streptomyces cacaoi TaxID=1898 RepID=UPI000A391C15|nr:DUF5808 domain-containing protein [Streptomyces cacaoi]NNG83683.1 hypothetical protein [Streptomyces cacaoi]